MIRIVKPQVRFEPAGVSVPCDPDLTILDAARQAGVLVGDVCGGSGSCGMCQVRVISDEISSPTPAELACLDPEALDGGIRLACMHPVSDGLIVETLYAHSRR